MYKHHYSSIGRIVSERGNVLEAKNRVNLYDNVHNLCG
jgi:hypothetical protein